VIVRETGRRNIPIPEFVFVRALGRLGFPKLPPGAVSHIKYPVVIDSSAFQKVTGFKYEVDEVRAMQEFKGAFPVLGH
jgi:UDP-glucose 4-epimerase